MRVITTLWFGYSFVFKWISLLMQAKKCDIIPVNDLTFKMAQTWTFYQDTSGRNFRGTWEAEETGTPKLKSLDFGKYPVPVCTSSDFFSFVEIASSMARLACVKRCCSSEVIITWQAPYGGQCCVTLGRPPCHCLAFIAVVIAMKVWRTTSM